MNPISTRTRHARRSPIAFTGDPAQGLPSFEFVVERVHPQDRPAWPKMYRSGRSPRRRPTSKVDIARAAGLQQPPANVRICLWCRMPLVKLVESVAAPTTMEQEMRGPGAARAPCGPRAWTASNRADDAKTMSRPMTSGVMQDTGNLRLAYCVALIYPCDPDNATHHGDEHGESGIHGRPDAGQRSAKCRPGELHRRCLHHSVVVDPRLPPGRLAKRHRIGLLRAHRGPRPKGDRPCMLRVHCEPSWPSTATELRLSKEVPGVGRRFDAASRTATCRARQEELAAQPALPR